MTTIFPDEIFLQQIFLSDKYFYPTKYYQMIEISWSDEISISSWALIWEGIKMLGLLIIFHLKRDAKKKKHLLHYIVTDGD